MADFAVPQRPPAPAAGRARSLDQALDPGSSAGGLPIPAAGYGEVGVRRATIGWGAAATVRPVRRWGERDGNAHDDVDEAGWPAEA